MRALGILLSSLAVAACNFTAGAQNGSDQAGRVTTRSFDLAGFDAIRLAGSPDVVVTVGGAHSVRAQGDAELIERLELRVEDGALAIGYRSGDWSQGWPRNRPRTTIFVTLPAIRAAAIAGSGDIRVDRVRGESFEASIAGSGDIEVGQLEVATMAAQISGSGDIRASGVVQNASASVAGSGDVDLRGVRSRTASANVVGSGDVRIQASETANVSIVGSGDVWVSGSARCTVSKRGSGTVHCDA